MKEDDKESIFSPKEYLLNFDRIAKLANIYPEAPDYVKELAVMKEKLTCLGLFSDEAIAKFVEMNLSDK